MVILMPCKIGGALVQEASFEIWQEQCSNPRSIVLRKWLINDFVRKWGMLWAFHKTVPARGSVLEKQRVSLLAGTDPPPVTAPSHWPLQGPIQAVLPQDPSSYLRSSNNARHSLLAMKKFSQPASTLPSLCSHSEAHWPTDTHVPGRGCGWPHVSLILHVSLSTGVCAPQSQSRGSPEYACHVYWQVRN